MRPFTPRASHKLLWCLRCCTSLRVSLTRGMQVRRGIVPDSDLIGESSCALVSCTRAAITILHV